MATKRLDLGWVRTQCERVRAELKGLVDWIPVRPLRGESVARWTGLKGPLCRRVLAGVQHHGEPAELARILPGVEGLEMFVDALERKGCPAERAAAARDAIRAFAELLHEGGGSQRRLVAALRDQLDEPGVELDATEAHARLFESARAVCRAETRALVVVSILHRAPDRPDELDTVGALGQLGYSARAGAPPLVARHFSAPGIGDEAGPSLHDLFGTPALPIARARVDERNVLSTYDGRGSAESPVDVWSGPVRNAGVVRFEGAGEDGYGSFAAIRTPTRTLVHDLWVETPLARASILRSGVYRSSPALLGTIDYKRWYERLPGDPRVLLPESDDFSGVERIHPRHADVVDRCFATAGLERREFVCYRCVLEHPIWMAIHELTLEFEPGYEPGVSGARAR